MTRDPGAQSTRDWGTGSAPSRASTASRLAPPPGFTGLEDYVLPSRQSDGSAYAKDLKRSAIQDELYAGYVRPQLRTLEAASSLSDTTEDHQAWEKLVRAYLFEESVVAGLRANNRPEMTKAAHRLMAPSDGPDRALHTARSAEIMGIILLDAALDDLRDGVVRRATASDTTSASATTVAWFAALDPDLLNAHTHPGAQPIRAAWLCFRGVRCHMAWTQLGEAWRLATPLQRLMLRRARPQILQTCCAVLQRSHYHLRVSVLASEMLAGAGGSIADVLAEAQRGPTALGLLGIDPIDGAGEDDALLVFRRRPAAKSA
ncbi:hypothetical protein CXG81DRAFT_28324 [Caulochytrium protostelioides]|uniref:Uncharacterized protein n=1 Tax=Caulochytrium protostelioides TaxID=1555241 RepID=A0A4P9X1P7_9FUNG|nr:hypothetical protein CXG81DRAFT_28324 [Caulochytrium protostelioides]|eukprot:RKO98883.1 hypothetical protein CXG81DRAFT_28324 [Caulochytrium protostelioides]